MDAPSVQMQELSDGYEIPDVISTNAVIDYRIHGQPKMLAVIANGGGRALNSGIIQGGTR